MKTAQLFAPLKRFHVDPVIALVAGILLVMGLLMMTSASVSIADKSFADPLYYLKRQSVFMVLGLVAVTVVMLVPLRLWDWAGYLALFLAFVLLTVVLVPGIGHTVNGSTRWIRLGFMNFQSSEAARLLMLFYVCSYLVRHQHQVREHFMGFAKPMLFVVVASYLLLKEPDFGAATVQLGMILGVLFVGGVRFRHYLLMVTFSVGAMVVMAMSNKERMERLTVFLDPWKDPFDGGFQLTQSLIAIGRGEWFGVGLGASVQKMFYLPEAHTDFVFAVLAEELGLIGAAFTIALYFVLVARGFLIARRALRAELLFPAYLAFGLSIWFGLQSFINIAVNMGALPTKGLTLPFMSYGGSSLIVSMVSAGLLLRVAHEVVCAENQVNTRVTKKGPAPARPVRVAA
ncbi:MAG: putative lipid II flippase FtsW [Gammaproteobacteria bacterium]|nr:putative lipid II flippase FtsW [Gammaproteobacteria bacterium]